MKHDLARRFLLRVMSICLMSVFALTTTFAAFSNGNDADYVLGQSYFNLTTPAAGATGMDNPMGVAIDPTTGAVFVADTDNNRVLRFANITSLNMGAAAVGVLGQPDFTSNAYGLSQTSMRAPFGVTVDATGTLWVADSYNHRVLRFNAAATKPNGAPANGVLGQPNFITGTGGRGFTNLWMPFGVTVGSNGALWVADHGNHRVLRYDGAATKANGAGANGVLGQINFTTYNTTVSAATMNSPYDVAISANNTLWVADYRNNRVLRFDNASTLKNGTAAIAVLGQPNFTSNAAATTNTGMERPTGVAIDSNTGTLWVAEYSNSRVVRFTNAAGLANGAAADGVLGQINFTNRVQGIANGNLNAPQRVAVGPDNTLLVADTFNNRVMHYDFRRNDQYIRFPSLPDMQLPVAPFTVDASASSGLPISFSTSTHTVCTFSGSTLTMLAAGTCTVKAAQDGNATYQAAQYVIHSFTVSPANQTRQAQTITFDQLPNVQLPVAPITLNACASSGLSVSYTSSTPAVCTISGTTLTVLADGTCTITAAQGGDGTYLAATSVTQSFSVNQATQVQVQQAQSITFDQLPNVQLPVAPITLNASASSGLLVSYISSTPAVCTISGTTLNLLAPGTCTVSADQAGNTDWLAAPQVSQSFQVTQAGQAKHMVYLPLVKK